MEIAAPKMKIAMRRSNKRYSARSARRPVGFTAVPFEHIWSVNSTKQIDLISLDSNLQTALRS
jgi:hypothetical protein